MESASSSKVLGLASLSNNASNAMSEEERSYTQDRRSLHVALADVMTLSDEFRIHAAFGGISLLKILYRVGNNVIFNRYCLSILHGEDNTVQFDNLDPDLRIGELTRASKIEVVRDGNTKATIDVPITLTDSNFEQALRKYPLFVVDFFAPGVGPCRTIAPTIEQMASEMAGMAVFGMLNVEENPRIANLFEVQSIPTVIMFRNGELVDGFRGVGSKTQIKSMMTRIMSL